MNIKGGVGEDVASGWKGMTDNCDGANVGAGDGDIVGTCVAPLGKKVGIEVGLEVGT
jgi:hypothetical protein